MAMIGALAGKQSSGSGRSLWTSIIVGIVPRKHPEVMNSGETAVHSETINSIYSSPTPSSVLWFAERVESQKQNQLLIPSPLSG